MVVRATLASGRKVCGAYVRSSEKPSYRDAEGRWYRRVRNRERELILRAFPDVELTDERHPILKDIIEAG